MEANDYAGSIESLDKAVENLKSFLAKIRPQVVRKEKFMNSITAVSAKNLPWTVGQLRIMAQHMTLRRLKSEMADSLKTTRVLLWVYEDELVDNIALKNIETAEAARTDTIHTPAAIFTTMGACNSVESPQKSIENLETRIAEQRAELVAFQIEMLDISREAAAGKPPTVKMVEARKYMADLNYKIWQARMFIKLRKKQLEGRLRNREGDAVEAAQQHARVMAASNEINDLEDMLTGLRI
ncbi:hypothetical protein EJ06DRAFT_584814 [Trichodelitschia bisporula]|uniref:Uncharacterized protein n=1 Tax=Trichodelitschia bisporula TaxID=703511 RepID=A0A6G1HLB9_9PEZI|nr:hypothetical protein EJ06DRAFT_584814 [Trichodelitschia bisporula]